MKKIYSWLVVFFICTIGHAMEVNKFSVHGECRWGDDKELAVAWYLYQYSDRSVDEIKSVQLTQEKKSQTIVKWFDEGGKKLLSKGCLEKLEKLEYLNFFITISGAKKTVVQEKDFKKGPQEAGLGKKILALLLMVGEDQAALRDEFIDRQSVEFHLYFFDCKHLQFNCFDDSMENLFKKNNKNKIKKGLEDCARFRIEINLTDDFSGDNKEVSFFNKKKLFFNNLNIGIKKLKQQKTKEWDNAVDCNSIIIGNYLLDKFVKMQADKFFVYTKKKDTVEFKFELGMREEFEQELSCCIQNVKVENYNLEFINKKFVKYINYSQKLPAFALKFDVFTYGWDEVAKRKEKECNLFFQDVLFFKQEYDGICNQLKEEKLDVIPMLVNIKMLASCVIDSRLQFNWEMFSIKGGKCSGNVKIPLSIPFMHKLTTNEKFFITTLVESNNKGNPLIKFTQELKKQGIDFLKKLEKSNEAETSKNAIKDLEIDINGHPPTFFDCMIIDLPLLVNTFIPDLLFYLGNYSGSMLVRGLAFSEFLGSISTLSWIEYILHKTKIRKLDIIDPHWPAYPCSSWGLGNYIFPWLDRTFNSHVALLKSFFKKEEIRTNIQQGESFLLHSGVNWTLSFIGNKLFAFNKVLGVLIHCIRIIAYYFMFNHVQFTDPISRGTPCHQTGFSPQKREAMDGIAYTFGDLKAD